MTVVTGPAATLRAHAGTPQDRTAGSPSDTLIVRVVDPGGNPVVGATILWTTSEGALASPTSTTDAAGTAGNRLTTVGMRAGSVIVAARTGALAVNFDIAVRSAPVSELFKVDDLRDSLVAGTADTIRVLVKDSNGSPRSATTVHFTVVEGGGQVHGSPASTSEDGTAMAQLVAGTRVGRNTVTAAVDGVAGITADFSRETVAGPAAAIQRNGPDPGDRLVGAADSIRVKVTDEHGNPRSRATVQFDVLQGGGSVSPARAVTDADGLAATSWKRGLSEGVNQARALVAEVGAVTFTVQTVAPHSLAVAPDVAILGVGRTMRATATVRDAAGAIISDYPVTLVSRTPAVATVAPTGEVTTVSAGQAIIAAATTKADGSTIRDSMVVAAVADDGVLLRTSLERLDLRADTTFTVDVIAVMPGGARLGSTTVDLRWNTSVLTYVGNSDAGNGVGATMNVGSVSSGSISLSMASPNGFEGSVVLRRITFRTSGSRNRTGTLALSARELTAAVTFENLLPRTTAVTLPLTTR